MPQLAVLEHCCSGVSFIQPETVAVSVIRDMLGFCPVAESARQDKPCAIYLLMTGDLQGHGLGRTCHCCSKLVGWQA